MAEVTAEKLSQRLLDVGLLDLRQVDSVWGDLGTRHVSAEDYIAHLVRKEFLTNFQVERLVRGERTGYFYGPYKVLYIIGAGTFARVYRAVHRDTGRIMAVKVLRRRFREEPAQLEQFLREARMGMKLRHPNIVAIHDVDPDVRAPYMVMEFVEGGRTLRDELAARAQRGELFDAKVARHILAQLCNALQSAHAKSIVHRDIKSENIMLQNVEGDPNFVRVLDFGLAKFVEEEQHTSMVMGTPGYMAP
ncbi:MAG: serine/threonine protein kinase, partial [Planctomycetales bacterium]|nr:serine/threonine protein kinase [Planctomycetales bacterium]